MNTVRTIVVGDEHGRTPLDDAVFHEYQDVIGLLRRYGAEPSQREPA